jgi:hypothetical protein
VTYIVKGLRFWTKTCLSLSSPKLLARCCSRRSPSSINILSVFVWEWDLENVINHILKPLNLWTSFSYTSVEYCERFIYKNLEFFNIKWIKYDFLKREKFKTKVTKIWMYKSNFEIIFYGGTFNNVLNTFVNNCSKT